MPPRRYLTAAAFRNALEERLRAASLTDQIDLNRLRRQIAFDRLLARMFGGEQPLWALKGGYALELRLKAARSTVDLDLTMQQIIPGALAAEDKNQVVREMLQEMARSDLLDWFEYEIGPPIMDLAAAPYGGARYAVQARLDARNFSRFHLDVGIGDVVIRPLETIVCRDWLGFAGIAVPIVQILAPEQHFAEKVHAYTLPRAFVNSRVKDLVDMVLLIDAGDMNIQRTRDALRLTFERRRTHTLTNKLPQSPEAWEKPFQSMAAESAFP